MPVLSSDYRLYPSVGAGDVAVSAVSHGPVENAIYVK